jgi:hypothetical protein
VEDFQSVQLPVAQQEVALVVIQERFEAAPEITGLGLAVRVRVGVGTTIQLDPFQPYPLLQEYWHLVTVFVAEYV